MNQQQFDAELAPHTTKDTGTLAKAVYESFDSDLGSPPENIKAIGHAVAIFYQVAALQGKSEGEVVSVLWGQAPPEKRHQCGVIIGMLAQKLQEQTEADLIPNLDGRINGKSPRDFFERASQNLRIV